MNRCAEPGCDGPAQWSEAFRAFLCDQHFGEHFEADFGIAPELPGMPPAERSGKARGA